MPSLPLPTTTALPIGATAVAVLGDVWAHRSRAFAFAAVPFGLMAVLDIGGTLAGINVMNEQWWMATASFASLVAFAPLTVSWFRLLVDGPSAPARPLFTIRTAEWHVIRLNVLLAFIILGMGLLGAGAVAAIGAAASGGGAIASSIVLGVAATGAIVVVGVALTRMTMAVAYAALERDIGLRLAWAITEGFALRLTILHGLMFALATGVAQITYLAQDALGALAGIADETSAGGWTLFTSMTATLFAVVALILVTALYAFVVRRIDAGQLGTGMGLLPATDPVGTRNDLKQAMAYLAKVRAEGGKDTIADFRALIDAFGSQFPLPAGVTVDRAEVGGIPGAWIAPADTPRDIAVLYLHGGGFMAGSSVSHARAAADIAVAARAHVFVADYRRAPEHPFPAAVEDGLAAYRDLLASGLKPGRIAFAGDSAGGGLVIAVMLLARERKLPMPSCGICLSPWVDLTCSASTYRLKAKVDPIGTHDSLSNAAKTYLAGADPGSPLASPVFADLKGLPPLLIQVGSSEVLLGDAIALACAARAAGVAVTMEQWPHMIHNWHMLADLIADGRYANLRIGEFLRLLGSA
jgi:phosphinothricin tripeptide acetyl hydrolase